MTVQRARWPLLMIAFCGGIAVAWITEAMTIGVGPVSRYLAPIVILGNGIATVGSLVSARKRRQGEVA